MSHFTEVKSSMRNLEIVQAACQKLGLTFEHAEQGLPIRGFMGDTVTAEVRIGTGTTYDLGLRRNSEGVFEFVADFEVLDQMAEGALRQKLMQTYSHLEVKRSLESQGFVVEEEFQKDGQIQMVVSQW
jgi:hypothetical protein